MKAILFKNGIYVGVDTNIDKTLDGNKIKESEELICDEHYDRKATLWGGRVTCSCLSNWELYVDGIDISNISIWNTSCGIYSPKEVHLSKPSLSQIVSYLNQMEQLGVDTFLANYKQALEKTKEDLTLMYDRLSSELSIQENESKRRFFDSLHNVLSHIIIALCALMINVNVGLDNHDYVDAYNAIVNECSKE